MNTRTYVGTKARLFATTVIAAAGLAGCVQTVDTGNTTVVVDAPRQIVNNNVCDPFADASYPAAEADHGIIANLFYLGDHLPRYKKTADYQLNGTLVDATLFLGNLEIMTRPFDRGFVTQDGTLIKNGKGETLYEYFALHFESQIRLRSGDQAGKYQFALIADDGAIMRADLGNGLETLVDDDGIHPTQMMCAEKPVELDYNSALPVTVDYFQGPRYHVALMLMWREWPTNPADVLDWECGKQGNGRFFNSGHSPSKPTPTYEKLLARGWRPVPAANFYLPTNVASNPCIVAQPTATTMASVTPAEAVTRERSIRFEFVSNYPDATFRCSLDGIALAECASPMVFENLEPGTHEFQVYAVSPAGIADESPEVYSWTIEAPPPPVETMINSVSFESTITNQKNVVFNVSSNYTDAVFFCSLDGGAAELCSSSVGYNDLPDGDHLFVVYAVNAAGEADPTPEVYSWTVDTAGPVIMSVATTATSSSVVINWTTHELATGELWWGQGLNLDNYIPDDGVYSLSHSITLTGLLPRTVYAYIIGGHDQAGNPIYPTVTRAVVTAR